MDDVRVLVDEEGSIWFRQSWLDTALRCSERGRLALVKPEWNEAINDAALIGTATHAAIQAALLKPELEADEVAELASEAAIGLCDENEVYWVNWTLPTQLAEHAARCARAWHKELRPHIQLGGHVEAEFKVPLFEWQGRTVGITGQSDYVQPDKVIVDWKTASRKFQQREKQRTAIQPTVYSVAATRGAFGDGFEYPVTFRYGVMVRGNEMATTQLIDVQRSHAHEGWLLDLIHGYLELAEALGMDKHWPRDEDHYLCNQTWCPWWSMCKGARVSQAQDLWSA